MPATSSSPTSIRALACPALASSVDCPTTPWSRPTPRRLPAWWILARRVRTLRCWTSMGAQGRYGFYEALDFTRARVPERGQFALVRCFMAHHQGMTIVAIANALHEGSMRARFHREPMIMASELLLQERTPRDVVVSHPGPRNAASADAAREVCAPCAARIIRPGRASHAPAVQRPLRGDADRRRGRLQPMARHRRHALARGRNARGLGHVLLLA